MKSLLILGAGGFGQMVKETAIQVGYEEIVFLDDAAFGKDVVGKCCDYMAKYGEYKMAVAAFGNNHTRLFWTDKLLEAGYDVPSIVHPSAIVSPSAVLGSGCFIMQRAVVNGMRRSACGAWKCGKSKLYDRAGEEGRGRRSNLLDQKKDRRCGQQSA